MDDGVERYTLEEGETPVNDHEGQIKAHCCEYHESEAGARR